MDQTKNNETAEALQPIMEAPPETVKTPKPRGFAAMKARGDDVSAIAAKGGKAAHAAGTAHQFSGEEARNAGKKGGSAPHASRGCRKADAK